MRRGSTSLNRSTIFDGLSVVRALGGVLPFGAQTLAAELAVAILTFHCHSFRLVSQ
jgi:hypothetical protein